MTHGVFVHELGHAMVRTKPLGVASAFWRRTARAALSEHDARSTEGQTMRTHGPKLTLLALGTAMIVGASETPRAHADSWTPDEVAIARHCVSERSFAVSDDCRVIAWVDRRNAQKRGLSIREWMEQAHSRHLHSRSRPWLAELDATGERPPSWPDARTWDRAREAWFRTLASVRAVLSGGSHGCNGTPLFWGGPVVDRTRLALWYSRGYVRLNCGATRNEIVGARR